MADLDLLTPRCRSYSNWMILYWMACILVYCLWQVTHERFLSRDCVELSVLDIVITWNSIYYSAMYICRLVTAGISNFLKKYGLKRCSIYLGVLSILAYILVVVILAGAEIQMKRVARDLLVEPLEKSVVEIEEMRGPIKVTHVTDEMPYSLEEHTKYDGEDVQFECKQMSVFKAVVIPFPDHVEWTKNGKVIHASDRINIAVSFENISEIVDDGIQQIVYLTSSMLKITFIEPNDYGNYSCSINDVAIVLKPNPPPPPMCPTLCRPIYCIPIPPPPPPHRLELPMFPDSEKDVKIAGKRTLVQAFSLVKMEEMVRTIRAPLGGIVSFSATYDNVNDVEDVSFDYTIGGRPFDSICDTLMPSCSFIVLYYWLFLHERGHVYDLATILNRVRMQNAITGTGWQCVCKGAYNIHSFSFYRRIFNVTSGREELWEAQYPQRILLAPRSPDLFFYNLTDKVDPVAKEPCWASSLTNGLSDACKQDETTIEWAMWIFAGLEYVVLSTLVISLVVFACLFIRLTNKYILLPIRNRILEGSWFPCKGCVKTNNIFGCIKDNESDPKHDVYISYDDHHLEISEQLANVIEKLGYTTFHQDRDLLGGQSITEAVSDAICASKKFVVLLTKEYIENGLCNRLEFQLLLRMVLNKSDNYDRLLIINRDNCYIPEPLKNCCILEWERNIDIETLVSKRAILYNWLQGKVREGFICNCLGL